MAPTATILRLHRRRKAAVVTEMVVLMEMMVVFLYESQHCINTSKNIQTGR
jgi:hypothetical protein